LYIDFLEFIEEKIRKSRNHLDVDDHRLSNSF